MALTVFQTSAGVPLINANAGEQVTGHAGNRTWLVADRCNQLTWFTDPACPPGVEVTYKQGDAIATYHPVIGQISTLTDSTGRMVIPAAVESSDEWEASSGVAEFVLASGRVATRYPLNPPPVKGSITVRVTDVDAAQLMELAQRPTVLWLLHDETQCPIRGCARPGALGMRITAPARTARTRRTDQAMRTVQLDYTTVSDTPTQGAAGTMGEACRMGLKCAGTLVDMIKTINGVSS